MKFVIKYIFLPVTFFILLPILVSADSFENILRKTAIDRGILPSQKLYDSQDQSLKRLGKIFFNSENLSLNRNISCETCHLKEFGSADGIPNAVGVGTKGKGPNRVLSGIGKFIPRNTLPLWGVGGIGFKTLFWDGKVDFSNETKISPFGSKTPSDDPLVVAVHLPAIEIGEMLVDDSKLKKYKLETTDDGLKVYQLMVDKLRKYEQKSINELAQKLGKEANEIEFIDIAKSIAAFIRSEFRVKKTSFEKFVFENVKLNENELKGGLIFYGKGKCSNCHDGPYFTDFKFHIIPTPQLGFGKNGFGVDYGRFNITFQPIDLYKHRTPPLYNVTKTAPYGHSGSAKTLEEVITYHFDPLKFATTKKMNQLERHEYYKRLSASAENMLQISYLTTDEVGFLVDFMGTLSFD
jgi:cytochrome c peroxidase